ncbi:MAG TPA: O-antigen ligase family protein [Burkholderiales bacterium]|nr:O-antigen ligase family protein [Burkholderiales bacterium]
MEYRIISGKADTLTKWVAVALGFTIPVSTALDSILVGLLVALWILAADYKEKWRQIKNNPLALLSLGLFGLLALGLFYGESDPWDDLRYLSKYKELLLIALLIPCFQDERIRRRGLRAFALALILTLLFSYAIGMGLLPEYFFMSVKTSGLPHPLNPVTFKLSITHNILMAIAAFLFAQMARHASGTGIRILWSIFSMLAVFNVLFMVQGRTGYLILALLVVYFFFDMWKWKGLALAAMLGTLLFTGAYLGSDTFHSRITKAASELSQWHPDQLASVGNSVGLRMEWYRNSLEIIGDHPVFGVGTGGFSKAYAEKIKGTGMLPTTNPHNQYLLIATDLGLLGLGFLLYLFYRQWRLAAALPTSLERSLAHALLLAIMFGCLFNSLLLDHTEGLLYGWISGLLYAGLKSNSQKSGTPT